MNINKNKNLSKLTYLAICKFAIFKIRKTIAIWLLLGVSIISFATLIFFIFFKSDDKDAVISNFQYYPLLFINIMLLLFILLIVIKIFGREFVDGTYLLLISRPFSRLTIFILKLITIWFLGLFFIFINLGTSLIALYISQAIKNNLEYLITIRWLIFELGLYSLFIVFLASSGFIFISTFLDSQTVILIGFIFCSLFLLGGMPYSLINTIINNIEISFVHQNEENEEISTSFKMEKIKETILFSQNLDQQKIKYYNLTKAIFDFYQTFEYDDLLLISNNYSLGAKEGPIKTKILDFYEKKLNLLNKDSQEFNVVAKDITHWPDEYKNDNISKIKTDKNINFHIKLDRPFKVASQLTKSLYHQELSDLMKDYYQILDQRLVLRYGITKLSKVMSFDEKETYFTVNTESHKETNFKPLKLFEKFFENFENPSQFFEYIFKNQGDMNDFFDNYQKIFNNQALLIFQDLESNIIKKVFDFKTIMTNKVVINANYKEYESLIKVYNIIAKINVIEHINQIWTANIQYNDYSFQLLNRSFIDFQSQKNYLMSYQDFPFYKNKDNKMSKGSMFLNVPALIYFYLGLSGFLLMLTVIILIRKNIV